MFHVSAPEELESSPPFCFDAYVKVISPLYLSPYVNLGSNKEKDARSPKI